MSSSSAQVLHIEDDPVFADLTQTFLEEEDGRFEVTTVSDGETGLSEAASGEYDCVVSDYQVPGLDGIELLEAVREEQPAIPFLLFTGRGSEEVASEAISAGVTDYLQKGRGAEQYELLINRIQQAIEKRRAERAADRARKRFERLIERATDIVMVLDERGEFEYVSPAVERVLGYAPDDLLGRSCFERIHPDDRAHVEAEFEQLLRQPEAVADARFRYRQADGSWRVLEARGHNLVDDPVVGGIVINARDVTARERRRRELERYETLIDTLADPVYTLDAEGHITFVNDTWTEHYGYAREDIVGEHISDIIVSDEALERRDAAVRRLVERDTPQPETLQLTVETADGDQVETEARLGLLPSGDADDFRGTAGVLRDISDRLARAEEIERQSNRLATVAGGFPDLTVVLSEQGEYVDVLTTPGSDELLVSDATEMTGSSLDDMLAPAEAERFLSQVRRALDTGQQQVFEYELEVQAGTRWFEARISPLDEYIDGERVVIWAARDVTEQKHRQRSLDRYERLIETLPVGVCRTTLDGQFVSANRGLAAIYGVPSVAELKQYPVSEFYADPAERETLLQRLRQQDVVEAYPLTMTTLDGETVEIEATFQLVEEDGQQYLDGIVRDVTDQRQQERRLERAETLFQNTQSKLFIVSHENGEFRTERVNQACEGVIGLPSDDIREKTPKEVLGDGAGRMLESKCRECVEKRAPLRFEETLDTSALPAADVPSDETVTHWETQIAPVEDGDTVEAIVGAARDITERRQRERELEQLNQRYTTLIDTFPNGVVLVFDEDLRLVLGGGTELDRLGLEQTDISGKQLDEVLPPEVVDAQRAKYRAALAGDRQVFEQEYQGEYYRVQLLPVEYESDTRHVQMVTQNVTEQKQYERKLERQNKQLEDFVSAVSHDLQNPLDVAATRLDLSQRECDSDHLEGAVQALDRAEALIDNLLTLIQEGETVETMSQVSLAELTEQCWATTATEDASLQIQSDRPIAADKGRLRRLLENLICNAVDHGGETVTVTVGALPDGFYVEDDGSGIPPEERSSVFERGYSTDRSGTGFGLAIVERIVTAHGWSITVTESDAGGARFEIGDVDIED